MCWRNVKPGVDWVKENKGPTTLQSVHIREQPNYKLVVNKIKAPSLYGCFKWVGQILAHMNWIQHADKLVDRLWLEHRMWYNVKIWKNTPGEKRTWPGRWPAEAHDLALIRHRRTQVTNNLRIKEVSNRLKLEITSGTTKLLISSH